MVPFAIAVGGARTFAGNFNKTLVLVRRLVAFRTFELAPPAVGHRVEFALGGHEWVVGLRFPDRASSAATELILPKPFLLLAIPATLCPAPSDREVATFALQSAGRSLTSQFVQSLDIVNQV